MVLSNKNSLIFYTKTRVYLYSFCGLIIRYGGEQQNYLDEVKNGVDINKDRIGIECEFKRNR